MTGLREGILQTCFMGYDKRFAGGDLANNKLDLEKLKRCSHLAALAVAGVAKIIREKHPRADLIIPVPNGATWLGRKVALARGIDCMSLTKDPETLKFSEYS